MVFASSQLGFGASLSSGSSSGTTTTRATWALVSVQQAPVQQLLLPDHKQSLTATLCLAERCPTLTNMLVIIVGGIPIAMPTVLSVTLALGAYKLARVR